jgi:putative endonuclease
MSYYVYILYSKKLDRYYTGYCEDISTRLTKHNFGSTPSTKPGIPWILAYTEEFNIKTEAMHREKQIKQMKSRKYIEGLINNTR